MMQKYDQLNDAHNEAKLEQEHLLTEPDTAPKLFPSDESNNVKINNVNVNQSNQNSQISTDSHPNSSVSDRRLLIDKNSDSIRDKNTNSKPGTPFFLGSELLLASEANPSKKQQLEKESLKKSPPSVGTNNNNFNPTPETDTLHSNADKLTKNKPDTTDNHANKPNHNDK